jgi:GNAT superfamily N-acetyltransferase
MGDQYDLSFSEQEKIRRFGLEEETKSIPDFEPEADPNDSRTWAQPHPPMQRNDRDYLKARFLYTIGMSPDPRGEYTKLQASELLGKAYGVDTNEAYNNFDVYMKNFTGTTLEEMGDADSALGRIRQAYTNQVSLMEMGKEIFDKSWGMQSPDEMAEYIALAQKLQTEGLMYDDAMKSFVQGAFAMMFADVLDERDPSWDMEGPTLAHQAWNSSSEIADRLWAQGVSPFEVPFIAAARIGGSITPNMDEGMMWGTVFGTAATVSSSAATLGADAPLVPAEFLGGYSLGFTWGVGMEMMKAEAGLALIDLLTPHPETGETVDIETARYISLGIGVINAAIEMVQLDTLPGIKELKGPINRAIGKSFVGGQMKNTVFALLKDPLINTAEEIAQEAVTIYGQELARQLNNEIHGTEFDTKENREILDQLAQTGVDSFIGMLTLGGLTGGVSTIYQQVEGAVDRSMQAASGERGRNNGRVLAQDRDGNRYSEEMAKNVQQDVVTESRLTQQARTAPVVVPAKSAGTFYFGADQGFIDMTATLRYEDTDGKGLTFLPDYDIAEERAEVRSTQLLNQKTFVEEVQAQYPPVVMTAIQEAVSTGQISDQVRTEIANSPVLAEMQFDIDELMQVIPYLDDGRKLNTPRPAEIDQIATKYGLESAIPKTEVFQARLKDGANIVSLSHVNEIESARLNGADAAILPDGALRVFNTKAVEITGKYETVKSVARQNPVGEFSVDLDGEQLIAHRAGAAIGQLDFSQEDNGVRINNLEVDPTFRRQGVGTRIVNALKEQNPGQRILWPEDMAPEVRALRESLWSQNPQYQALRGDYLETDAQASDALAQLQDVKEKISLLTEEQQTSSPDEEIMVPEEDARALKLAEANLRELEAKRDFLEASFDTTPENYRAEDKLSLAQQRLEGILQKYFPRFDNEAITAGVELFSYRATSAGMDLETYVAKTFAKQDIFSREAGLKLNEKGAAQFLKDGRALIRLGPKADFSTIVHELAHIARRQLAPETQKSISIALGVNKDTIDGNRAAEEAFARGFEEYLLNGSADNVLFQNIFTRMKGLMRQVYSSRNLEEYLQPELKEVFESVLFSVEPDFWESNGGDQTTNELYQIDEELDQKNLLLHNLSTESLGRVKELGGLPTPFLESLDQRAFGYGDFTIILDGKIAENAKKILNDSSFSPLDTVPLGFIKAAVVPKETPAETRAILENAGIPVYEYGETNRWNKVLEAAKETNTLFQKTDSPEFKAWFKDSKIVDEDGDPVIMYHTTTHNFEAFDRDKAHQENAFGKGFYFSSSAFDSGENYDATGPDLTNRIETLAERMDNEELAEVIADETGRDVDEVLEELDDEDRLETERERIARKQLMGEHQGATMPVYLSIKNPFVLGGEDETFIGYEESYDEETEEYGEPEGQMVEFMEALRFYAEDYMDYNVDDLIAEIWEQSMDYGGMSATKLWELFSTSDSVNLAMDPDTGNLVNMEILREALHEIDFDGMIDHKIQRFNMNQIHEGDYHVVAFEPNQIKSVFNKGQFSQEDDRILYQTDDEAFRYLYDNGQKNEAIRLFMKAKGVKLKDSSIDRDGAHSPAGPEDGAPLWDVSNDIYPDDVYDYQGLMYYGTGEDAMDRQAWSQIQEAKGKPHYKIKIYRAVEKDYTGRIIPGDWVTTVRAYAKDHGESALNGDYRIISKTVTARDIYTSGDSWLEWGYHPQDPVRVPLALREGTKTLSEVIEKTDTLYQSEDQENFERWFNGSQVIDNSGEPLQVFHGTPDGRELFGENGVFKTPMEKFSGKDPNRAYFFTDDFRTANTYADDRRAFDYQNAEAGVGKFFLSLRNPMVIDAGGKSWGRRGGPTGQQDQLKAARDNGHDGVIIKNTKDTYHETQSGPTVSIYIAFSPNQIKSVNNRGTFDPNDDRILYQTDDSIEQQYIDRHLAGEFISPKILEQFGDKDWAKKEMDARLMNSTSYETAKAFTDPEDFIQDTIDFREAFGDDGSALANARDRDKLRKFWIEANYRSWEDQVQSFAIVEDPGLVDGIIDYIATEYLENRRDKTARKRMNASNISPLPVHFNALALKKVGGKAITDQDYRRAFKILQNRPKYFAKLLMEYNRDEIADTWWKDEIEIDQAENPEDYLSDTQIKELRAKEEQERLEATPEYQLAKTQEERDILDTRLGQIQKKTAEYKKQIDELETDLDELEKERDYIAKEADTFTKKTHQYQKQSEQERARGDRFKATLEETRRKRDEKLEQIARLRELSAETKRVKREISKELKRIFKKPSPRSVYWRHILAIEKIQDSLDPGRIRMSSIIDQINAELADVMDAEIWKTIRSQFSKDEFRRMTRRDLAKFKLMELVDLRRKIERIQRDGIEEKVKRDEAFNKDLYSRIGKLLKKANDHAKEEGVQMADPEAIGSQETKDFFRKLGKRGSYKTLFLNPERVMEHMDGGFKGPFWEEFYRDWDNQVQMELAKKISIVEDVRVKAENVLKGYNQMQGTKIKPSHASKKFKVLGSTWTVSEMVGIWASTQNQDQLEGLIYGHNMANYQRFLDEFDKIPEYRAFRAAAEIYMDKLEELWPELYEAHAELKNQTLHKTPGRYWPRYVKNKQYSTLEQQAINELGQQTGVLRGSFQDGFTKARIKVSPQHRKPQDLDFFGVVNRHFDAVSRYIASAQSVKMKKKIVGNYDFRDTVSRAYGDKYLQELVYITDEMANPEIYKVATKNPVTKFFNWLRNNATSAFLAYNHKSFMMQTPSAILVAGYMKNQVNFFKGIAEAATKPMETYRFVTEDPQMKERYLDRSFMEAEANANDRERLVKRIREIGFMGFRIFDSIAITVAYRGLYLDGIAQGMDEAGAREFARDVVTRTQPSGHAKDLPRIMKGGEMSRWLTMFGTQLAQLHGMIAHDSPMMMKEGLKTGEKWKVRNSIITMASVFPGRAYHLHNPKWPTSRGRGGMDQVHLIPGDQRIFRSEPRHPGP